MSVSLSGARGVMRYRHDGNLLFDFDALNAIVRDGEVCELPDASQWSEPDGAIVVPIAASKMDTATGWELTGAGTLVIAAHVASVYAYVAPALTVPGTQTTDEDTNKNITGISVADADTATPITVALSATHGTLSLAQTTGLTFTTGDGVSDASMEFSGSLVNVNLALATLTFIPTANYNGGAVISIDVTDDEELSDADTINVTVGPINDAIFVTIPGTQSTAENTNKAITGISVADVDAVTVTITTLSVTNGTLSLAQTTGLTFTTGDGTADATMSFSGSLANVNAALATVTYTPTAEFGGAASLYIEASDGVLSDNDTLTIDVAVENDAPVVTCPVDQAGTEDTTKVVTDLISISDVDSSTGTWTVAIATTNISESRIQGGIALSGSLSYTSGSQYSANKTVTGTLADILGWIGTNNNQFIPPANFNGVATVTVTATDPGGASGSDSFDIVFASVQDAPMISGYSSTMDITPDSTDNATALGIVDGDGDNQTVSLQVYHGTIKLTTTTGLSVSAGAVDGSSSYATFSGTLANINAALASYSYTPTLSYLGPDFLDIGALDSTGRAASAMMIYKVGAVDVNPFTFTLASLGNFIVGGGQYFQLNLSGSGGSASVGPIYFQTASRIKTEAEIAAEVQTAIRAQTALGGDHATATPSNSGSTSTYTIYLQTVDFQPAGGHEIQTITFAEENMGSSLGVAVTINETTVTNGVADIEAIPGTAEQSYITATPVEYGVTGDTTSDSNGNYVSCDENGNHTGSGGPWFGGGSNPATFTAPSNGPMSTTKASGNGSVGVGAGVADIPAIPGSPEVHNLAPSVIPGSGTWQVIGGGSAVNYDADTGTMSAAAGSQWTFNQNINAGTVTATNIANGDTGNLGAASVDLKTPLIAGSVA